MSLFQSDRKRSSCFWLLFFLSFPCIFLPCRLWLLPDLLICQCLRFGEGKELIKTIIVITKNFSHLWYARHCASFVPCINHIRHLLFPFCMRETGLERRLIELKDSQLESDGPLFVWLSNLRVNSIKHASAW